MRISDILSRELIVPALKAETKTATLNEMAHVLANHDGSAQITQTTIASALLAREELGSTGVGEGVAIPHAKLETLHSLVAAFGRSHAGIPFDAIDDLPVHLVFVLLVPGRSTGAHLKALARISRLLKNPKTRETLLACEDQDAIVDTFVIEDKDT